MQLPDAGAGCHPAPEQTKANVTTKHTYANRHIYLSRHAQDSRYKSYTSIHVGVCVHIHTYTGTYTLCHTHFTCICTHASEHNLYMYIYIHLCMRIYRPWVQHVCTLFLCIYRYVAHDARMQAGRYGTREMLLPAAAMCVCDYDQPCMWLMIDRQKEITSDKDKASEFVCMLAARTHTLGSQRWCSGVSLPAFLCPSLSLSLVLSLSLSLSLSLFLSLPQECFAPDGSVSLYHRV